MRAPPPQPRGAGAGTSAARRFASRSSPYSDQARRRPQWHRQAVQPGLPSIRPLQASAPKALLKSCPAPAATVWMQRSAPSRRTSAVVTSHLDLGAELDDTVRRDAEKLGRPRRNAYQSGIASSVALTSNRVRVPGWRGGASASTKIDDHLRPESAITFHRDWVIIFHRNP